MRETLLDCVIWSIIALIVQIVVYYVVRIPIPDLAKRIAAAILRPQSGLGSRRLRRGALSAASISY